MKVPCQGNLEDHAQHIEDPPARELKSRLGRLRIDEGAFARLVPLVCIGVTIRGGLGLSLKETLGDAQWKEHVSELKPRSLTDLKDWVGVPNEVALRQTKKPGCEPIGSRRICEHHLPHHPFRFDRLNNAQRSAVTDTAYNLLYGYADEELIRRPPYQFVVDHMLDLAGTLHMFCAPSLIVCPGERVTFKNFAALCFNNVVVYQGGQIFAGNHVKLHAYQIKHV